MDWIGLHGSIGRPVTFVTQCNMSGGAPKSVFMLSSVCLSIALRPRKTDEVMSERPVIFTLLMDEPPNGKLPVLSVHSFAVLLESNLKGECSKGQKRHR